VESEEESTRGLSVFQQAAGGNFFDETGKRAFFLLALRENWGYFTAMELLDQLEQRIGALLAKLDALSTENAALKEGKARELASITGENTALRQELERERAKTAASLSRLEGIIALIKEQTDQE
jgi:hypothetical protein